MKKMCIYCQAREADSKDHVPPEGMFPKPLANNINLITVPCCKKCNGEFHDDDEYLMNLSLEWDAARFRGEAILESRIRSMERGEHGKRLWAPFIKTLRKVSVYSPSGRHLADSLQFTLDMTRVHGSVNRIIRGLYFKIAKKVLPLEAFSESSLLDRYVDACAGHPDALRFLPHVTSLPGRTIGEGVFQFGYMIDVERPGESDRFRSFWYLVFYQRFTFIGWTGLS